MDTLPPDGCARQLGRVKWMDGMDSALVDTNCEKISDNYRPLNRKRLSEEMLMIVCKGRWKTDGESCRAVVKQI